MASRDRDLVICRDVHVCGARERLDVVVVDVVAEYLSVVVAEEEDDFVRVALVLIIIIIFLYELSTGSAEFRISLDSGGNIILSTR